MAVLSLTSPSYAAELPVDLGTAGNYAVLAATTVTNGGATALTGDLGVSPGTAITGFPPGTVNGSIHAGDSDAAQAHSDLVDAYDDASARIPTDAIAGDLTGQTLTAGIFAAPDSIAVTGTLILDGEGDLDSLFVFQIGTTITTAAFSEIRLVNGAQACHVFWRVGSSATLGATSTFKGTILAMTSITVGAGTAIEGRALARDAAVTLDSDTITTPGCEAAPATTTEPPTTTTPSTTTTAPATTTTTEPATTTTAATPTTTPPTTTTAVPSTTTTTAAPTTTTAAPTTTTAPPTTTAPATTTSTAPTSTTTAPTTTTTDPPIITTTAPTTSTTGATPTTAPTTTTTTPSSGATIAPTTTPTRTTPVAATASTTPGAGGTEPPASNTKPGGSPNKTSSSLAATGAGMVLALECALGVSLVLFGSLSFALARRTKP